ncbi:hypothetical protein RvY_16788 [Ramazzottius varieornatus]|uniref:Uncharacterized protein n=1 Tax=Ramazzottius varieornatus TaxID=947166 RepID=A0A1D1W613_RAMVA|nr:hypothetical protein RvY_16788 [Ramazzottius varieornatus]
MSAMLVPMIGRSAKLCRNSASTEQNRRLASSTTTSYAGSESSPVTFMGHRCRVSNLGYGHTSPGAFRTLKILDCETKTVLLKKRNDHRLANSV